MNILNIYPTKTKLSLSKEQVLHCGEESCYGYISPSDIKVTTCGTYINADNVIPQTSGVKMRVEGENVRVCGIIDGQEVISLVSKKLISPYFSNCKKKFSKYDDKNITYYSDCKHIKFIINNQDIYIGR